MFFWDTGLVILLTHRVRYSSQKQWSGLQLISNKFSELIEGPQIAFLGLKVIKLYKQLYLLYNLGNYIFAGIFTLFSLFEVKIQALLSGFKGLNFNLKQTKLSKNPDKNIMSRIITQGSCINRNFSLSNS